MKSYYRGCEAEITVEHVFSGEAGLTPIVEIQCNDIEPPHLLTTKETFKSEPEAQKFGANMAREWIDANVKRGETHRRA